MEKAVVMGCACVVVSSLTPEQLESAKRYAPEVLKLKDETGEVVFSLDIDEDLPGHVTNRGRVGEDSEQKSSFPEQPAAGLMEYIRFMR